MEKKGSAPSSADDADYEIEKWRLKRLIKNLSAIRGNGTSMISLLIPPRGQIPLVNNLLVNERGTASNIQSRVNRLSVLSAIESAQQKLKLYKKVPPNGLAIFSGTDDDGKRICISFEPFRAITQSLYMCGDGFDTKHLLPLVADDETYGFIIVDGKGALFGKLSGANKEVLHKFSVDLPPKHGRGGQSKARFDRIRKEKIANYVRKVAEATNDVFNQDPVKGIVIAGSAHIKDLVVASDIIDYRIKPLFVKMVDIAYGGENGFQHAIELSADILKNVRYVKEKAIMGRFQNELIRDTGKIVYGLKETMRMLDQKILSHLIVCETITYYRCEYASASGGEDKTKVTYLDQKGKPTEPDGTGKWILIKKELLIDWLDENISKLGIVTHIISEATSEGSQFSKGFGGVGGFLYYKPDKLFLDDDEPQSSSNLLPSDDIFDGFI